MMTYAETIMQPSSKVFRAAVLYHKAFRRQWLSREVAGVRVHSRVTVNLHEYVMERIRPLTDMQLIAFNEQTIAVAEGWRDDE